ncbi:MAG: adenylate/guanylate cyclase domain-containing protein, partial [Pseudomonadota bacterium]
APVFSIDAPVRAIRTALAIAPALATLNQSLVERGLQPISMGVGINTDQVVVGNMGSQSRLNYTAIGDGVNLASRLEGLTKRYGVAVIVSESTRILAPEFLYLELDLVRVKGKQDPVRVYEPLCTLTDATPLQLQVVAQFTVFLQLWQAGFFAKAAAAFAEFVVIASDVPALMQGIVPLYQQRVTQFVSNPPAQWDGVVTFDEK